MVGAYEAMVKPTPSRVRIVVSHAIGFCKALTVTLGLGLISLRAQGVATRNAAPEARPAVSGKPWLAQFRDVAAEAGLTMTYQSGNETFKISEAFVLEY